MSGGAAPLSHGSGRHLAVDARHAASSLPGMLLPGQQGDDDGPMFAEAWHAEVFALAVSLADRGVFSWSEWTTALSEAIAAAQTAGDPDLGDTYYDHWLAALEALCGAKGIVTTPAVDERTEAWRAAYLHTRHGQPVELSAADRRDNRPDPPR